MSIFKFYKPLTCLLGSMLFATNFAFGMESEPKKEMCAVCKNQAAVATVYDNKFYTLPKKVCSIDCSVNWINKVRQILNVPALKPYFPNEKKCIICTNNDLSKHGCMIFPCGHISFCLECNIRKMGEKRKCCVCRKLEDNNAEYGSASFIYLPNELKNNCPKFIPNPKCGEQVSWIRNILRKNYNKINIEFPNNSNELAITRTKEGQISAIATNIYVRNFYRNRDTLTEEKVSSILNDAFNKNNVYCKFLEDGNVHTFIDGGQQIKIMFKFK